MTKVVQTEETEENNHGQPSSGRQHRGPTDREDWVKPYVVFAAAFISMAVISPYEYAWSSMSGHIGGLYHWSHTQIVWMFTLSVIFKSVGTLPGGVLRDMFGPRWVTIVAGLIAGLGIFATALGRHTHRADRAGASASSSACSIYNTAASNAEQAGNLLTSAGESDRSHRLSVPLGCSSSSIFLIRSHLQRSAPRTRSFVDVILTSDGCHHRRRSRPWLLCS